MLVSIIVKTIKGGNPGEGLIRIILIMITFADLPPNPSLANNLKIYSPAAS